MAYPFRGRTIRYHNRLWAQIEKIAKIAGKNNSELVIDMVGTCVKILTSNLDLNTEDGQHEMLKQLELMRFNQKEEYK